MISAVILTWNSGKYIKRCLDSLISEFQNSGLNFEIFVVDNGSEDETREILGTYEDVNLIPLDRNTGTTYSRNLALRKARGDFVLILDSDTEVKPGVIKKLLSALESDGKIGIIAPKLFYDDGSVQRSFHKFPTIQLKFFKVLPFGWSQKLAVKMESYVFPEGDNESHEVDYCVSAFWLLPKRIVDKIGLLDEKIFYSPEDVDYCLRVWLEGNSVVYYPAAEVMHHSQRISYKYIKFATSHLRGLFYFFRKHNYLFSRKSLYRRIKT